MVWGSAWVHFVLVEQRALVLVYFSARGLIAKIGVDTRAAVTYVEQLDCPDDKNNDGLTPQWVSQKRLQAFVQDQMMSLKQSGEFDTGCGSIAYENNNEGYFHAAVLVAVATTFITCLVLFGIHSTSRDFTSAGYLQFTYRLEKMFAYRMVARSLMVFACGAYVAAILFVGVDVGWNHVCQVVLNSWTSMAALAFSIFIYQYPLPVGRSIADADPELSNIKFNRSFMDFFTQSNDKFGILVSDAMVAYGRGDKQPLMMLLADPGLVDEAGKLLEDRPVQEKQENMEEGTSAANEPLVTEWLERIQFPRHWFR